MKNCYRNKKTGKIAGVCAGIADYFGMETWLARVILVSLFLLGAAGPVFILYIALWLILDVKPENENNASDFQDINVKNKSWQSGKTATEALEEVGNQLTKLEGRLQSLEYHATSKQFALKKQINDL